MVEPLDLRCEGIEVLGNFCPRVTKSKKDLNPSSYPEINDFTNSTAVARVNGYVGGFGTQEALQEELEILGLSSEGMNMVLEISKSGLTSVCKVPSQ